MSVTITSSPSNFLKEVKNLTDGKGFDVVYDSVGATTFDKSLDYSPYVADGFCPARGGRGARMARFKSSSFCF